MPLKLVRNDITQMNTEAIVNTANEDPIVGAGCDYAIYSAAGYDVLLAERRKIGKVAEGQAFITKAYNLSAKYIIHAVSPLFIDGKSGEEERLRSCYRNSLNIARENNVKSIAFPVIGTGSYGYPLEEGMRIAFDEISSFLLQNDNIQVYLVVFGRRATKLGENIYPNLKKYIDNNYVEEKRQQEYSNDAYQVEMQRATPCFNARTLEEMPVASSQRRLRLPLPGGRIRKSSAKKEDLFVERSFAAEEKSYVAMDRPEILALDDVCFPDMYGDKLKERTSHLSDTFSEYLMYIIDEKKLKNSQVYHKAMVDKKVFSKIKNNKDYHPDKFTALRLCVGAQLNIDETKDILARAGYALSPCDLRDIIFSFFIENSIYDMVEIDLQLEEYGLPYLIK